MWCVFGVCDLSLGCLCVVFLVCVWSVCVCVCCVCVYVMCVCDMWVCVCVIGVFVCGVSGVCVNFGECDFMCV